MCVRVCACVCTHARIHACIVMEVGMRLIEVENPEEYKYIRQNPFL